MRPTDINAAETTESSIFCAELAAPFADLSQ